MPCGVRLLLELVPAGTRRGYDDFRYFAPPALTDLNDLNEDGIEEYLETRSLHFREDRLNLRSLLAWSDAISLGIVLSRADRPAFDPIPERAPGVGAFLQNTDIGSLGIEPLAGGGVAFVAAYPFAERSRSNALRVKEREPFAAFAPAITGETFSAAWLVRLVAAPDVHGALWAMWTRRYTELAPLPVNLPVAVPEIAAARVDATLDYFIEEADAPFAAGFVTNCYPQDGKQISNVIQFGFTGQNNLNAFNLLRDADARGDPERRRKALRVFDFFVATAAGNRLGLIPGFYNADTRRFGSWWTGLILPLAYAEPGSDLEALMGPLYGHLRGVVEALAGSEGIYLRCVAEEYDALLAAYRHELARGVARPDWLARAKTFADFLVSMQNADGSFFRAYADSGAPITRPENWFGQTDVQQKSSTATVVPLLLDLFRLSGDESYLGAARRAAGFAREWYVDRMRHNGGIHDSIYAKPQSVDGESIMFCMRALLELHKTTGAADDSPPPGAPPRWWSPGSVSGTCRCRRNRRWRDTASGRPAGWRATHPAQATSTRWACSPCLTWWRSGLLTGERLFLKAAELLQAGCNETVETAAKKLGLCPFRPAGGGPARLMVVRRRPDVRRNGLRRARQGRGQQDLPAMDIRRGRLRRP